MLIRSYWVAQDDPFTTFIDDTLENFIQVANVFTLLKFRQFNIFMILPTHRIFLFK